MSTSSGSDNCVGLNNEMRHKIIAQTIFLGASVIDYNCNLGWGTQPSTLTINLVNDNAANIIKDFDTVSNNEGLGCGDDQHSVAAGPNDYYHATNDNNLPIYKNDANVSCSIRDPTARLTGKVYYKTDFPVAGDDEDYPFTRDDDSLQVNQLWWGKKDPGFLGDLTNIELNGSVKAAQTAPAGDGVNVATLYANRGYNITNCPVYFKMLDFSFGGFVQSWKKNKSNNGDIYTVVINGSQSILNTCTVILDKYGGSIAGKLSSFDWSAPSNYVGNQLQYNETNNSYGNIPNIFNVYGFLESFGADYFGGSSYKQEEGFLVTEIVNALRILTGADDITKRASEIHNDFGPKNAFSPYGRIIAPSAHDPMTGAFVTTDKWGLIKPTTGHWEGNNRCNFKLDLSEISLAITGSHKRIKVDSMSISELIDQICDEHGLDWTTTMINTLSDGWVIKVIAVSRRFAPLVNGVKSTVSKLVCDEYPVGSFSYGKESNDVASRSLIIGPNQQRLYQAKNTRLAYTQSNYIFSPGKNLDDAWSFVDYYVAGRIELNALGSVDCTTNTGSRNSATGTTFGYGKIKFPAFFSTRNPILDDRVTSLKNDEEIKAKIASAFNDTDTIFQDSELSSSFTKVRTGNYGNTKFIGHGVDVRYALDPCGGGNETLNVANTTLNNINEQSSITNRRFYPLYRDVISPFFGYLLEDRYKINAQNKNTDFRRIRPVWYDFWTGQICVLFHKDELPRTRIGLRGRYTSYTLNRSSSVNMVYASSSFTLGEASTPIPENPNPTTPEEEPEAPTAATPDYTAEWFMVTESEFRAAAAGKDSFMAYTLGKIYKSDLFVMMHAAYIARSKKKFIDEGNSADEALRLAKLENDWNYDLIKSNSGDADGINGPESVDTSNALQKLPTEAKKDFDLLSDFIKSVGQTYYGKKYMVMAPFLQSRTETSAYKFNLRTDLGDIKVFKGGGEIRYNYEPCANDNGAWEEYGNQIDDVITCGDNNWSTLSNDKGQINPILGYNATPSFDYFRYMLALKSIANAETPGNNTVESDTLNPYFSYTAWDDAATLARGDKPNIKNFYFENLHLADLARDAGNFVIVDCPNNASLSNQISTANPFTPLTNLKGLDAFGRNHGSDKQKLYKNCNVSPKFSFLDPEKMLDPRMIIETNTIRLNNSSEQFQTDPANTISALIGMEDLAIYTRAGGRRDDRIKFLTSFFNPYLTHQNNKLQYNIGGFNTTAKNLKVAAKCAHPLFAGIPIKSNTYCYGPWTNYPALLPTTGIFSTGIETSITNSDTSFKTCSTRTIEVPTVDEKHKLIDNFITDTKFEIKDDFAPWNFGGMAELDDVAMTYASGSVNYQTNIEVGSLDIAGAPLFNLGGSFSRDATNHDLNYIVYDDTFTFTEVKHGSLFPNSFPNITSINDYMSLNDPSYVSGDLVYKVPSIAMQDSNGNRMSSEYYTQAPILTNIMTSMGQNGTSTKYSFRTYTRKLSLFNKQDIDRSKKMTQQNMMRKKEIANLAKVVRNNQFTDRELIKREQDFTAGGTDNTVGTSPVTTLVCSARVVMPKFSGLDESNMNSTFSAPSQLSGNVVNEKLVDLVHSDDPGGSGHLSGGFSAQTDNSQLPFMYLEHRVQTEGKLYPDSELGDALRDGWGSSSVMSLDGIFSPISFYPTLRKSTYSISKYRQSTCPICNGDKKIKRTWKVYNSSNASVSTGDADYYCDSCVEPYKKLNGGAYSSSTTTTKEGELYPPYILSTGNGLDELKKFNSFIYQKQIQDKTDRLGLSLNIPINITTLQPIVMPQNEFKNANAQNYEGEHPDEVHAALTIDGKARSFIDKGRNSISVIGKGSIYKDIMGGGFKSETNISQPGSVSKSLVKNYDYDYLDSRFMDRFSGTDYTNLKNKKPEQNMRFVGLRGPLMLHGWGYDNEGYPVPNACDEPYDIDGFGRPMRFKQLVTIDSEASEYATLAVGEAFSRTSDRNINTETVKLQSKKLQNDTPETRGGTSDIEDTTSVYKIRYYDDMTSDGGYPPDEFKGSIISKTQKFNNGSWSRKIKLKQFYLNWAERPDLWPAGPVDLRWDEDRKVWAPNTPKIYKDIYITLEEDMSKDPDLDESFPARGFFDDASYSTQALDNNERKLVYVKDRSGYTAPRGSRLFCRYDVDTGFYEPLGKPQYTVYGAVTPGGNTATITMNYVQGKKRGESAPTMVVNFKNPLGLSTTTGAGMFSYINGEWTLISSR
tara:strand:+ start:3896 stop:10558 length:6663 start_codon:yes stop_codon:yes gene_type:complete